VITIKVQHHRLLITLAAVIILAAGIWIGTYLASNLAETNLEAAKIGLSLTTIIILLIIGSLVLGIKETLESKGKK
jgi:hypothetical protein